MNQPMNPMAGMMNNVIGKAMQNNPILGVLQAARNGGNPMVLLQNMAKSNPQVAHVMNMVSGKSPAELESFARNVAKERGTTLEQVAQQLGIQIPQRK